VWGRVYIDGLRVLNIIRKTRPYRHLSGRVSPTIHAYNQPSGKPAPTDICRGGFHQPSTPITNHLVNPPPHKEKSVGGRVYIDCLRVLNIIPKTRPDICRGGFHQPSTPITNHLVNPPPHKEKSVWGRVYIDCLRVLNIIRKTRPYRHL
jgi:hypothetical protein